MYNNDEVGVFFPFYLEAQKPDSATKGENDAEHVPKSFVDDVVNDDDDEVSSDQKSNTFYTTPTHKKYSEADKHELAKNAKDMGSAAVLLSFVILGTCWLAGLISLCFSLMNQ